MESCPLKIEVRRELDTLWKRTDEHGAHITDVKSAISRLEANENAANIRHERLLTMLAEARGEDRKKWDYLQTKIDALVASDVRRKEAEDSRTRMWRWLFSALGIVIAAIALTGEVKAITNHKADKSKKESVWRLD